MRLGLRSLQNNLDPRILQSFSGSVNRAITIYTAERHKLLANQPDIPTIVKRIQQREAEREAEERIKAERIAAWRNGLLDLTDIEIYELAVKILVDRLHVYGSVGFFQQHFKNLNTDQPIDRPQPQSDNDVSLVKAGQMPTTEPRD